MGQYAVAFGANTTASGQYSQSEGDSTIASGQRSHATNDHTIAQGQAQTAIGRYNIANSNDALIIGSGSNPDFGGARANAFRFQFNGQAYGNGFNSTGADYAEMFEWLDGNPQGEDKVGYFITVQDGKIRKANANDRYILGVTSTTPSVVGDSHGTGWRDMYLRDNFGRIIYEWVDAQRKIPGIDKTENIREHRPKLNPAYDPAREYIPRDRRKEWAAVGMMGKLIVRDDGTCKVDGFCKVADGGIATASESGYFVLARLGTNLIRIVIKGS